MYEKIPKSKYIELIEKYKSGKNIKYLAKIFNVHPATISKILKKNNVKIRQNRKYIINQDFFDVIDNPEKAYFLGLLYADGCNCPDKQTVSIALSEKDRDILETFNNLIYITKKPLKLLKKKEGFILGYKINSKPIYGLYIYSKHMCNQLIKWGCVPNKTRLAKFPAVMIKSPNLKDFIRGFFDGDGHIGVYPGNTRSHRKYGQISFVGTNSFLQTLKILLEKILNIECTIKFGHRTNKVKELWITKQKHILKFLDWLYERTYPALKRKYDAYLELKRYETIPLRKRTSDKVCIICGKPHSAKGYCSKHYEQLVHAPLRRKRRHLGLIDY